MGNETEDINSVSNLKVKNCGLIGDRTKVCSVHIFWYKVLNVVILLNVGPRSPVLLVMT